MTHVEKLPVAQVTAHWHKYA